MSKKTPENVFFARDEMLKQLTELKKENEKLKEQVSRREIFRLREKISVIEQDNKKLKKENNELKLYKDLKKKNWLNSGATLELKRDLEKRTIGRDKWKSIANEVCEENDVLLKDNERLREENQEMFAEMEQLKKN
jgi:cell shape-determining protein MreC